MPTIILNVRLSLSKSVYDTPPLRLFVQMAIGNDVKGLSLVIDLSQCIH